MKKTPPKKTITVKNVKFIKPKKPLDSYSKKGQNVEKEHTSNKKVQKIIDGNHEDEFPNYYSGLSKMEKALKEAHKKMLKFKDKRGKK
jgi:hypothetical protein